MKIAPIIVTSIARPRSSRPLNRLYLDLFFVFQLDAGARGLEALDRLGDSLDEEQQAGEGDHRLVGPEDGPPRRLLGGLADLEGVPALLSADHEEGDERRKKERD